MIRKVSTGGVVVQHFEMLRLEDCRHRVLNRTFATAGSAFESVSIDAADRAILETTLVCGQRRRWRSRVLRDGTATEGGLMGVEVLLVWSLHAFLDGGNLLATACSLGLG